MNSHMLRSMPALLLASTMLVAAPSVYADIVSTEQVVSAEQNQLNRDKVRAFLDRAAVQDRLQAMGVQGVMVRDRVDALSDQEVATLAQRIDAMPAGGNLGSTDLIIILLVAILVAIAV